MENLPEQLEKLLLTKAYDQLTTTEKNYVDTQLSQSDYEQYRAILTGAQSLFQQEDTLPDPAIKRRLIQQLHVQKSKMPPLIEQLKSLLNYPVPAWQVSLACLLLWFTLSFTGNTPSWNTPNLVQSQQNERESTTQSRAIKADKELLNLFTGVQ